MHINTDVPTNNESEKSSTHGQSVSKKTKQKP